MTKCVRIENADTSDYQVVVEIWDRGYPAGEPDVLVRTVELNYPTAITDSGVFITSSRYLVVKEAPKVAQPIAGVVTVDGRVVGHVHAGPAHTVTGFAG